jgi:hypothetical protein
MEAPMQHRRARRLRARTLLIAATAVASTACGASDDEVAREDLVATFTDTGYSTEMGECMADALIDEFGIDAISGDQRMTDEQQAQYGFHLNACVLEVGIDNVGDPSLIEGLDCSTLTDADERARCEQVAPEPPPTLFIPESTSTSAPPTTVAATMTTPPVG